MSEIFLDLNHFLRGFSLNRFSITQTAAAFNLKPQTAGIDYDYKAIVYIVMHIIFYINDQRCAQLAFMRKYNTR